MHKSLSRRVVYYTRKVEEKASHHPAWPEKRSYRFRHQRLMQYKKRLMEIAREEV